MGSRVDSKVVDVDEAGRLREVGGALRQDEDGERSVRIGLAGGLMQVLPRLVDGSIQSLINDV